MDLDVFAALRTSAGQHLLARADAEYTEAHALKLGAQLRREHPGDLVAAALTQAALRRKARTKFGPDAELMYFTPDGYEQATRARVAEHRARRFADAGVRRVVDLGCGIGGDLIAFARAGIDVTGIDIDPLRVAVANANIATLDLARLARAHCADATSVDTAPFDAVFADPARRTARGRVFDPAAYQPAWSFVTELLGGDAGVKVAPGIPHDVIPAGVEAEWVSDAGEVKEAALWSGRLRGTERRASLLPNGHTLTEADLPLAEVATARPLRYLYEPSGAVIRAGLVAAVAREVGGYLLDPHLAYVTSDQLIATPFAAAFRVDDVLPYNVKTLRAALRARGAGTVTVKKRGIDVDPETLRRKIQASGPHSATVVLVRVDTGALALLVQPCRLVQPDR